MRNMLPGWEYCGKNSRNFLTYAKNTVQRCALGRITVLYQTGL